MQRKLPTFSKVNRTPSAEEWLANYEELLKRNRGGGVVSGYDTDSSYSPMMLSGNVADPTGLGEAAPSMRSQPAPVAEEPVQSFLDILLGTDVSQLTDEEIGQLLDMKTEGVNQQIDTINESVQNDPVSTYNSIGELLSPPTPTAPIRPIQPNQPVIEPTSPPPQLPTLNFQSKMTDNIPDYVRNTPSAQTPITMEADKLLSSVTPQAPRPTYTPQQVQEKLNLPAQVAQNMKGVTDADVESVNAFKASPDYAQKMGESFRNRTDQMIADQKGMTVEQLKEENAWRPEPAVIKNTATPKQNPIRLALGNAVETVGDAIPFIGEHNISEMIAGGPTKHSGQVMAADNIQISEPDPNMELKAGAGIDALKGNLQSAQSSNRGNIFAKPSLDEVAGLNRQVGDFVGKTAAASANMKSVAPTPVMEEESFDTPPMSAPMRSQNSQMSYSRPQQNYNQPNQSSNNNQSSYSAPRPTPAPTPSRSNQSTKSTPAKQSYSAPKPTPVPTPAPTPRPSSSPAPKPQSQPSNSIFTTVVNAIKNLFRRK